MSGRNRTLDPKVVDRRDGAIVSPAGDADPARRAFLVAMFAAGVGLILPGCGQSTQKTAELPGPAWPESRGDAWRLDPRPEPAPVPAKPVVVSGAALPRRSWTRQDPTYRRMQRMVPVRYVTVHHSAGPIFRADDQASTARHLESIRRYHHDTRGWGDIGYHYAVDRAGRVWECRPPGWQGAHVRDHNEGNIGVVVLGNFDSQQPTTAQLDGVHRQVTLLMRTYRVPVMRLRTHQEWSPTACPGRSMQRVMVSSRSNGKFG